MTTIFELQTPALLLDIERLQDNIRRTSERAKLLGVRLRPHLKTHKCVDIAQLQRASGAIGVTVSTIREASVFVDHGFDDITWAYPIPLSCIDEAVSLAQRARLSVVVDSLDAVQALVRTAFPFSVFLKVDVGYHRAGVDPNSPTALDLVQAIASSPRLEFAGLLSHAGHAYYATPDGITGIAEEERQLMVSLRERIESTGINVPTLSVGSTPQMAFATRMDGISEARPGIYVFYDYVQAVIGSCALTDCALTVFTTVISSRPAAKQCIVDAGALALSKDPGSRLAPHPSMGEVFEDYGAGRLHDTTRLIALDQEHGWLSAPTDVPRVGTRLRVLPNYACLTAACFDEYFVVRGEEVIDRWRIWRDR